MTDAPAGRTGKAPPSERTQILGSLVAALVIAAIAIALVTAKLGPTSSAELEAAEDRRDQRIEAVEERAEAEEERRERLEERANGG
jgi:hypothetical protein